MKNIFEYYDEDVYLAHHGIKGQRWGIRRFQNPDGTLTEAGKKRHNSSVNKFNRLVNKSNKQFDKATKYNAISNNIKVGNTHRYSEIARRAHVKSMKNAKRASKIFKKLSKDYKDRSLASLEPEIIAKGAQVTERYRYMKAGKI